MDYKSKLEMLEKLKFLVDRYDPIKYQSGGETKELHEAIVEVYGSVDDVFEQIVGRREVVVPIHGASVSRFPNYFEAGYLSGRTIHAHEGRNELIRVIGRLKALASAPAHEERTSSSSAGQNVFIVHGHDDAILHSCARFVEKLQLKVVVLREQPNQGRTIIEKLLDHSDVAFAIVLFTGDDRGGKITDRFEDQQLRARQNVVLELGFFIGKLGRERVCVLYQDSVEIPSDYHDIVFLPLDSRGSWRLELAKEMKAAGLPVDLNAAT